MLNTIDLFVGCGGLSEGFEQSRKYKMIGAVEWEPSPVKELRNHLKNRCADLDMTRRILEDALIQAEKKIIIVIDDIDRLANSQIRDVFQLVKQVADFPNVIYLLAMDREVVRRALMLADESGCTAAYYSCGEGK